MFTPGAYQADRGETGPVLSAFTSSFRRDPETGLNSNNKGCRSIFDRWPFAVILVRDLWDHSALRLPNAQNSPSETDETNPLKLFR